MSNPKRHHFVPKAYLDGFIDQNTGFLNVYSKRTDRWRKQKPDQVMVRNKYYRQDWAPEGVDKNILEKRLGAELEPEGLATLNKLIEMPESLDSHDMAVIITYLQFQRLRVPRQADMAKALAKIAITNEMSKTSEGRLALEHAEIIVKDTFRFEFLQMMANEFSPFFARMNWEIIEADVGLSFITSDSPVTFFNVDFLPPSEPGVALYGTIVLFPINKRFLLILKHPEYVNREKAPSESIEDYEFYDGLIAIRRKVVWGKKDVDRHNSVMWRLSQDLVVGESKEILEHAIGKPLNGDSAR